MASASHASSPQRHRGSVAGPSGAGTRQSSPQRSGALAGTLDILSRWASIVTAPPIAQRQQDEEFWRTGPGAGVVRAETVGAPRSALSQSPGRRRGLSEASQVSFMLSASPATSAPPAAQRSKTIILPVRVEPKVQFANERTFLGWMNYAVILTTISMTLLNYGDRIAQITGLLFTAFSLLTMLYGLILFLWRGHRIRQRIRMPYDDLKGPPTLMAVLFVGTFVNFAVRWAYLAREGAEPNP